MICERSVILLGSRISHLKIPFSELQIVHNAWQVPVLKACVEGPLARAEHMAMVGSAARIILELPPACWPPLAAFPHAGNPKLETEGTQHLSSLPLVPPTHSTDAGDSPVGTTATTNLEQPQVIPSQGDLLGDLLNLDLGPPVNVPQVSSMQMGAVDLLGGGLDSLVSSVLFTFS